MSPTYREVIADAWSSSDPDLASTFSTAIRAAIATLGFEGSLTSEIVKRAWDSDSKLREEFGVALSRGLIAMWADPAARAKQSKRIKKAYDDDPALRARRREDQQKLWTDPTRRTHLTALARERGADPAFRAKLSAVVKQRWADPEARAKRLAARPVHEKPCEHCGVAFRTSQPWARFCSPRCRDRQRRGRGAP